MSIYSSQERAFLKFARNCNDTVELSRLLPFITKKLSAENGRDWKYHLLCIVCKNKCNIILLKDVLILYINKGEDGSYNSRHAANFMVEMISKMENNAEYMTLVLDLFNQSIIKKKDVIKAAIQYECDELVEHFIDKNVSYANYMALECIRCGKVKYLPKLINSINIDESYEKSLDTACYLGYADVIDYLWSSGKGTNTLKFALASLQEREKYHSDDSDTERVKWAILEVLLKHEPNLCTNLEIAKRIIFYKHETINLISPNIRTLIDNETKELAVRKDKSARKEFFNYKRHTPILIHARVSAIISYVIDSDVVPSDNVIEYMLDCEMFQELFAIMNRLDMAKIGSIYQNSVSIDYLDLLKYIDQLPDFNHDENRAIIMSQISNSYPGIKIIDYLHSVRSFTQSELNEALVKLVASKTGDGIKKTMLKLLELGADISTADYVAFYYVCEHGWWDLRISHLIHLVTDNKILEYALKHHKGESRYNHTTTKFIKDELLRRKINATDNMLQKMADEYIFKHSEIIIVNDVPLELQKEVALRLIEKGIRESHNHSKNQS